MKNAREQEKKWLEEFTENVMAYILSNTQNFTPFQHLRSHRIKNMLLELEKLVEKGRRKKAIRLSYDIDDELFLLLFEPIKDAQ
jgi:hypothetical protein